MQETGLRDFFGFAGMSLAFLDGNDDAFVWCRSCGDEFDLSSFDLPFDADHGDILDDECPSCGCCDCLRVQA